jgi:hypothetical protein
MPIGEFHMAFPGLRSTMVVVTLGLLGACSKPADETRTEAPQTAETATVAAQPAPAPETAPPAQPSAVVPPAPAYDAEAARKAEMERQDLEFKAAAAEARARLAEYELQQERARQQADQAAAMQAAQQRENALAAQAQALAVQNAYLQGQADAAAQQAAQPYVVQQPVFVGIPVRRRHDHDHRPGDGDHHTPPSGPPSVPPTGFIPKGPDLTPPGLPHPFRTAPGARIVDDGRGRSQ